MSRGLRLTEPGAESVGQKLRLRLGLRKGEWFLDTRVGVPWYTDILGRQPPRAREAVLRRVIVTSPGVRALESFALTVNADRSARLSFSVRATSGETITVQDFIAGVS